MTGKLCKPWRRQYCIIIRESSSHRDSRTKKQLSANIALNSTSLYS